MRKDWCAHFKVKVTAYNHNITISNKPGVMICHHKLELFVKKLGYCVQSKGHSDGLKCQ